MDTIVFSEEEQEDLKQQGVRALVLFGSRAKGMAHRTSDYDIGVLGGNDSYNVLYMLLEAKIGKLVNIDIVDLEKAPMELGMHVVRFGRVLFEEKPGIFDRFKEFVMSRYADFAPYRNMFHAHILRRASV